MADVLHMKVGRNIGRIMLEIAQEHIINGEPEGAITTYTEGFGGMTKEYALMLLKGQSVLITMDDGSSVNMVNDEKLLEENQKYIYNWNMHIKKLYQSLIELRNARNEVKKQFERYSHKDINDFRISEPVEKYYGPENMYTGVIGIHHIAARILAGDDLSKAGSGATMWSRLEDHVENEDRDTKEYEYILYYAVRYVNIIKQLYKEYMKFSKIYTFLLENDFIKRICYIEEDIEGILSIIYEFCNPNTRYYHPLCDEAIAQLKDAIDNDILTTAWGKEYRRNGIIEKNIMDGYDAGWLSPNGIFYAENGPDENMMHMYIAIQLFNGMLNTAMIKDGVKESSGNYLPEQWLERHGWMKIHRDEIYGYFYGERKDDKEWPYCPTEKQIKAICDYTDKYYNGKFYMTPKIVGKTAPLTTYQVRQMDEIMLHDKFNR